MYMLRYLICKLINIVYAVTNDLPFNTLDKLPMQNCNQPCLTETVIKNLEEHFPEKNTFFIAAGAET